MLQVIDLNSYQVEDGLHWCKLISDRCIVLIAGGDGTIGYELETKDYECLSSKFIEISFNPDKAGC